MNGAGTAARSDVVLAMAWQCVVHIRSVLVLGSVVVALVAVPDSVAEPTGTALSTAVRVASTVVLAVLSAACGWSVSRVSAAAGPRALVGVLRAHRLLAGQVVATAAALLGYAASVVAGLPGLIPLVWLVVVATIPLTRIAVRRGETSSS